MTTALFGSTGVRLADSDAQLAGPEPVLPSSLEFVVPPELSAHAPAEARGLRRDGVRLLVGRGGRQAVPSAEHHRFTQLPEVLRPGDLLVVNNSATLPAALPARLPDGGEITLHVSATHPDPRGAHLVELRRTGRDGAAAEYLTPADNPARSGLRLSLPAGGEAVLTEAYTPRLWYARLAVPGRLPDYLAGHGKAIRYGYVDQDWPVSAYQTVFAAEPGSSEMPSAARPFTDALVSALVARGVLIAPITLHTGVASRRPTRRPIRSVSGSPLPPPRWSTTSEPPAVGSSRSAPPRSAPSNPPPPPTAAAILRTAGPTWSSRPPVASARWTACSPAGTNRAPRTC